MQKINFSPQKTGHFVEKLGDINVGYRGSGQALLDDSAGHDCMLNLDNLGAAAGH